MFNCLTMRNVLILLMLFPSYLLAETAISEKEVLIEIKGKISVTTQDNLALIDRKTINALPQHQITTTNHITSTPITYRGPLFRDLLRKVGAKGSSVLVIAWDDYMAEIEMSDLKKYDVILATHENGQQLTLDTRGPLFVVFPFSDHPDIRNDLYYNKSVWQIRTIEVQ